MSDVGLILILVVLVLGGVIATVGDRLGTRVGKARLSLFNLRPKQTAVVVTILTGTLISASTLGVLLLASRTFREMVLNFGRIQADLRATNRDLDKVTADLKTTDQRKAEVEKDLEQARSERAQIEEYLKRLNANLQVSVARQRETDAQLRRTEAQRDLTRNQLETVSQQALSLRNEINQLESEQQALIEQRDQVKAQIAERDAQIAERTALIEKRDREINERDQVIAQREAELKTLEQQRAFLVAAVQQIQQDVEQIRRGDLAIFRTQVLSSGVVRVVEQGGAKAAVDQLLQLANQTAIESLRLGQNNQQIVQIPIAEVQNLIQQIQDGKDYLVRVQAGANYVLGDDRGVVVNMSAVPNQVVFLAGDTIATQTLEPSKLSPQDFQKTLQDLIAASNARARVAGVMNDRLEVEKLLSLGSFIDQLRRYPNSIELRAVASDVTYTAGPLKIELVAVQDGQVVLRASN
ncbi:MULTISPECIES: DUF3084 domain-containing protein [Leptolyngbya]|jgi:uncharacterized protein (DUF3084 family)|uniref:DUF3084 domain-containing protein n=2 Tax=Leptolyngbya boryana TaxID=1184 RepID=A0A1Z4JQI0_LEPBY|nr:MULTISPECIES: DUF3084 domain-containing protein [Leptolyngbya]BAY58913.1 hypothetical protein NIES2135_57880 [Leptolyngbya boryana NIES-2135]MBD1859541.1 DUF3084 domain-containing protein [Leptolyngbya sp. FACHB-1624]MBD2370500.1 DUF3084 domain-containing protein [Leptolyngbya sp. FACHB-161]MBD2376924.1 DUF3084 domain-containing protein [Leptolyngbya sp. FACHB-238]MBD2401291.1 DUF3084 domain-containing protein [Leptolyngbya sp. FACHB-239]